MARRMLINAIHPEETRVAIADDDELVELEVEKSNSGQLKSNIYKAKISRIEPSLQAAFLDIGSQRNGFLQINDIHPTYFRDWPPEGENGGRRMRPAIQDVLEAGQDLVVQVVKDERDEKGATLTTNLSLPGRYLVLMVGNQRGGVSRKIVDERQRYQLRQAVQKLRIPIGMGVIVRTAGINKSATELQRDLDSLLDDWHRIIKSSFEIETPRVLYSEPGLAIRTIRDYLTENVKEIQIDDKNTFESVRGFVESVMPRFASRVLYYDKPQPLFSNFHLDGQIDATTEPEVRLPSGGSIVVNVTEAVVAIDVNSGRATSQADVEETAFATNVEAAKVIAKQLRLRDLGGLVVIDFIDMWDRRHKQGVEKTLKDAVRNDKAKIEMGRISRFGLLEMSRQRLKASLVSQSHMKCPNCMGSGRVKTAESAALEALRKIQSSVFAGGVTAVRIRMAPSAALFLLNQKRQVLSKLEDQTGTSITVYADGRMKPEQYELELETSGHIHHEHSGLQDPPSERNERRGDSGGPSRGRRGDGKGDRWRRRSGGGRRKRSNDRRSRGGWGRGGQKRRGKDRNERDSSGGNNNEVENNRSSERNSEAAERTPREKPATEPPTIVASPPSED